MHTLFVLFAVAATVWYGFYFFVDCVVPAYDRTRAALDRGLVALGRPLNRVLDWLTPAWYLRCKAWYRSDASDAVFYPVASVLLLMALLGAWFKL